MKYQVSALETTYGRVPGYHHDMEGGAASAVAMDEEAMDKRAASAQAMEEGAMDEGAASAEEKMEEGSMDEGSINTDAKIDPRKRFMLNE